ncbi:MAG: phosphate/phosphite/phosphonate ABC transporter substrate-binding protein [Deltaproteobacteria bacterium]|nr:phosphate/phosphite/phosphonate ABC transporter substrate-binding protein [Deltaproteobacteria bacterium]MBW2043052.1 phosphate/phosphite/phosphonate ABC transporter substrate-binding protein [Deltaproteobacteria bacterium]MBW2132754.1 phosphate/phosphite/phosphonate ABC transporter substrate-binding protein [Deltaproteobacteria bacterium]
MMRGESMPKKILFRLLAGAGILFLFPGCDRDAAYQRIDFSKTLAVEKKSPSRSGGRELRVAVAAMISPKETFIHYKQLIDYIADRSGRRVRLIQRKTYEEVNVLFPKRQIDLAFICTGPYAAAKDKYGFEAIATPVIRGAPFYQSYLIVNKDSPYQGLEDLRGRVFAFTDPDSNTGALVPRFWIYEMGDSADRFFSDIKYTFSHDNSILAVAKGLVDAAAVDGHKWEFYNLKNSEFTSRTRVIKKSKLLGSPPFVASVHMAKDLKNRIQKIVLAMHETPEGQRILNELMIDRFAAPKEEWYRPVREMVEVLNARENSPLASHES